MLNKDRRLKNKLYVILITIENSRFVRGKLLPNKYLPFYPRAFTTLKGITQKNPRILE